MVIIEFVQKEIFIFIFELFVDSVRVMLTRHSQCIIINFFKLIILLISALSAGLAAPLIGAGAVAVLGSGSAAIFTGASGVAVITSIFGAAGAGLTGN